jgi:hypothetical protein
MSRPLPAVLRVASPSNCAPKIIPAFLHPCFVLLARRVSRPVIPLSSSVASSLFGGLSGETVFRGCLVELHNAAPDLWKVEHRLPLQSEASSLMQPD